MFSAWPMPSATVLLPVPARPDITIRVGTGGVPTGVDFGAISRIVPRQAQLAPVSASKQLKRAGMDYWQHVKWHRWRNWHEFESQITPGSRVWYVESNGPTRYSEANFKANDYLVFGRETAGLPKSLVEQNRSSWLRIPMFNPHARSLNLSNCVALVLFEALRQSGFNGELA